MDFARPGLDPIVSNYPNRWSDMIRPMKPDILFCWGFNWKLPDDVPRPGALNGHDALLPTYWAKEHKLGAENR